MELADHIAQKQPHWILRHRAQLTLTKHDRPQQENQLITSIINHPIKQIQANETAQLLVRHHQRNQQPSLSVNELLVTSVDKLTPGQDSILLASILMGVCAQ